jgi:DNA-binding response OmpR family regulator
MSKGIILICDNDQDEIFTLQEGLTSSGFEVVVIQDAIQLVSSARSLKASVVIANPDMNGFNDYDVCKYIKKEMNIPVMLTIDKNSTARASFDQCTADDVITKPYQNIGNISTLISKHIALQQQ